MHKTPAREQDTDDRFLRAAARVRSFPRSSQHEAGCWPRSPSNPPPEHHTPSPLSPPPHPAPTPRATDSIGPISAYRKCPFSDKSISTLPFATYKATLGRQVTTSHTTSFSSTLRNPQQ